MWQQNGATRKSAPPPHPPETEPTTKALCQPPPPPESMAPLGTQDPPLVLLSGGGFNFCYTCMRATCGWAGVCFVCLACNGVLGRPVPPRRTPVSCAARFSGYSQFRTCTVVPHCVFTKRGSLRMEVGRSNYWGARGHLVGHGSHIQNWKLKQHSKVIGVALCASDCKPLCACNTLSKQREARITRIAGSCCRRGGTLSRSGRS